MTAYMPHIEDTHAFISDDESLELKPNWVIVILPEGDEQPTTLTLEFEFETGTRSVAYEHSEELTEKVRMRLRVETRGEEQ